MRGICLLILTFLISSNLFAQKPTLTQLTKLKVDSLKHAGVDTIVWYKSYCGECNVASDKNFQSKLPRNHFCTEDVYGYSVIDNVILYKQNSRYYKLTFDCTFPLEKTELDTCRTIPYFISILPVLKSRDKTIKAMVKKSKFLEPLLQSDGFFENAGIVLNKSAELVSMGDSEKYNDYKLYKRHYWTYKEIKLLDLITKDISTKK